MTFLKQIDKHMTFGCMFNVTSVSALQFKSQFNILSPKGEAAGFPSKLDNIEKIGV